MTLHCFPSVPAQVGGSGEMPTLYWPAKPRYTCLPLPATGRRARFSSLTNFCHRFREATDGRATDSAAFLNPRQIRILKWGRWTSKLTVESAP